MPVLHAAAALQLGHQFPLWSVAPFVIMLIGIAVLPLVAGRIWEYNHNKALLSLVLGAPVAIWTATLDSSAVVHAAGEYVAFIVLLGALFVISGGIVVRGTLAGTPGLNTVLLGIAGKHNFLFLAGVMAVLLASGTLALPNAVQDAGIVLMIVLSWLTTPKSLRAENGFSWSPIVEVAALFAGIFATMIPALAILNASGAELHLQHPWHYFWASGALSSFLDNAPTYLTFASAASGAVGTDAADLGQLLHTERGATLLAAICMGSVFMGANTYIGNGPNFMVKAIAEQSGDRMPGFSGYMGS